ncbi:hypothetical protein CEXT_142651 [Caerostris extrusa]|uniref:Uncharacterized protein n=1 Tax=Caerostris extrusa TaxID=172846 RepID=A0AAV4SYF3_CAEEX|nr:hypothetical protein CEXT_142651 [Caerostris extrusa]
MLVNNQALVKSIHSLLQPLLPAFRLMGSSPLCNEDNDDINENDNDDSGLMLGELNEKPFVFKDFSPLIIEEVCLVDKNHNPRIVMKNL